MSTKIGKSKAILFSSVLLATLLLSEKILSDPTPREFLLIGDSLGVGLKPHLHARLRGVGIRLTGNTIIGSTIPQWRGICEKKTLKTKYEGMLVVLGTNDAAARRIDTVKIEEAITKLKECAHSHKSTIVWIGPPFSSKLKGYEEVTSTIKSNVEIYIDYRYLNIKRSEDEIHFSASGYAEWSDIIMTDIETVLISPKI